MDPFEDIFPDILEKSVAEAGELVGESPEVQEAANRTGEPAGLFSPPQKSLGLVAFGEKAEKGPPVYMTVGLDLAIELAGRLIMLPADEIAAARKQGKLEGELLDAFSEIANIISGVLNSVCHEAFAARKLHFVKGELEVVPAKTKTLPLAGETHSAFSGEIVLNENKQGRVEFFLPHSLLAEEAAEAEAPAAEEAEAAPAGPEAAPGPETASEPKPEPEVEVEAEPEAPPEAASLSPETVSELLLEGLEPAREELEGLLGDSVSFAEEQTGFRQKRELLAKTRGKLVMTRIRAHTADGGQGAAYMLLPLKDAIYFGGVLLMMPAESITQTVKQGKFEGDVADAFGEVANILVGCYSQQFKAAEGIGLTLKKGEVESLVAGQVDPEADAPFPRGSYYVLAAKIGMGEKTYGPLELFFPPELLGLAAPEKAEAAAVSAAEPKAAAQERAAQKEGPGQKSDRPAAAGLAGGQRVISIIGEDTEQFDVVEKSITDDGVQASRLSLDENFKQFLSRDNPSCVFLVIKKVNDQGLAKAIKVRSALSRETPLIVAGPEWTKSLVLKARKYGATDILITPAETDVVRKKYQKYL
ncbi:MAG: hypothetical protein R6X08_02765 [Desulfosalsimonadaceae bacterium]